MAVDTSAMMASLADAGLVDGSGAFTSAPNFGGPAEGGARHDPVPADEPGEAPREEPAQEQPKQEPASQPQVRPTEESPASGPAPRGDLGPSDPKRLGDNADPIRLGYEQTVQTLEKDAQMAFLYGQMLTNEQGERVYSDQQLAQLIGQELQAARQQAYLGGVMQRLQPVAQRAAAEKIAKEHGVDVADIVNEASPIAMETRAKTIAELKRDGRFQERKSAGTDTAEGSRGFSSAIPEAIEKLTPQQKMYVGFARGDY